MNHASFGKNVFMGVLDGKVALVTGASRGIGAEIARRFGAAGAAVAVAARTTADRPAVFPGTIDQTVAEISAAGGTAVAIAADLSRPDDRVRLVEEATARLGRPDILVNNAAVTYFAPVPEFTAKRYALMFAVQVEAPFHLATLVLPGLRARGAGWILNISSGAARHPAVTSTLRGGTVYGMCKAALERFSTGLAAELYDDNIAVNALSPSRVVPTPGTIFHHLTTEGDPRSEPPAVMAEAALLLCHREPRALTGRIAYSQELLAEFGVPVPWLQPDAGGQAFAVIAGVAEEQLAGLGPLEVQVRVVLPGEADAAVDLDVLARHVRVHLGRIRFEERSQHGDFGRARGHGGCGVADGRAQ